MGYKYFAFAGTSNLFDEDERPATVDSTILQQIISGQGSTGEAVVMGVNTNYFARAKRMASYAERAYVRGLPTSDHDTTIIPITAIQDAIFRAHGRNPGRFLINEVGTPDEDFLFRFWMKDNYSNETYFDWTTAGMPPVDPIWDESRIQVEIPVINPDTGLYYLADNDPDITRIFVAGDWLHQLRFHYTDNLSAPATWTVPVNIDWTAYETGEWIQVAYTNESIANFSFESGDVGWENTISATHPTATMEIVENEHFEDGTWAAKLTCPPGTSARLVSKVGTLISPGTNTWGENRVLHKGTTGRSQGRLEYFDAGGAPLGSFGGGDWGVDMNGAILDTWMISEWQGIAPANAAEIRIGASLWNPPGSPTDAVAYFDSFTWDLVEDSQTYYFLYKIGSDVDPILEAAILASSEEGKYLPVAILMHDKTWFDDPVDTPLHKTTNKLLKYLAVKGDEVKEDYLEQQAEDIASGDDTRDGAEEWDFFIHFACSIHSKVRGSMDYMYNWLLELETFQTFNRTNYEAYLNGSPLNGSQPRNLLHITEGDVDGFNVDYGWSYVESITYPGTFIDEDGDPLITNRMHSVLYERTTTNLNQYRVGLEEMHGIGIPLAANYDWDHTLFDPDPQGRYQPDYVIFTKQWNDANGDPFYTRVICMGLSQQFKINTLNTDITGESNYNFRYSVQYMFGDEEAVSVDLRVPIKMNTLKQVPTMHREDCITDALVATVFLVKIVHVKWYQSGFWSWLIIIIAVVLIVLSFIYGGVPGLVKAIGAATALTGFALYMFYWVLSFAIGFIISMAGALIGGTAGRIFMIIAMVASAGGNPFANVKTTWANMRANMGWATAQDFIMAMNPFIETSMILYTDYETRKLEQEQRDWLKTAKERYNELEEAWADLGQRTWMDPMDLVRAQRARINESPEGFYARTLNPNPGLLGYDMITEFSEISLGLPETIENTNVLESMFESLRFQRGGV